MIHYKFSCLEIIRFTPHIIIQYLFLLSFQSFADLWVDFLLKETEKRESAEAINASNGDQQNTSLNDTAVASPIPNQRTNSAGSPASRLSPSPYQYNSPLLLRGNILQPEHLDSEFSTVPLTSSERITSQVLRPLPRY